MTPQERTERDRGRHLAKAALGMHKQGIAFAVDTVRAAMEDGGKAKKLLRVELRPGPPLKEGGVHVVALVVKGDKTPLMELWVHTKPAEMKATDNATATPIEWETEVTSVVTEESEDGKLQAFRVQLWSDSTGKIIH